LSEEINRGLAEKVMEVLGEQYDESLDVGQHPFCFFAQEHLEKYMHRVLILDPDKAWELPQRYYVFIADNPIGEFKLNPTEKIPKRITLHYAKHKKTKKHLPIRNFNSSNEEKRDEYEIHDVNMTKREVELILRIAANWADIEPYSKEEILAQFKV
jgi:hypothetical protein